MEIYYSKTLSYFELTISILIIGVGIYLISIGASENYFLGGIMILIGIFGSIKQLRKSLNTDPQIIISGKGIITKTTELKTWSVIEGEEIIQEGYGKSAKSYLVYWYDNENFEKFSIDELNVSHRQLENIVRTYRIRYEKNFR